MSEIRSEGRLGFGREFKHLLWRREVMSGQMILRGESCVTPADHVCANLSQFLSHCNAVAVLRGTLAK
jgi:hypothetical protein